jgi:hypothetical protein
VGNATQPDRTQTRQNSEIGTACLETAAQLLGRDEQRQFAIGQEALLSTGGTP